MIEYTTLSNDEEIHQLLELQSDNLAGQVASDIAATQGFVTVQHDFELLKKMNEAMPQIIAKDGKTLAGYALVMLPSFQDMIPVLKPMFIMLEKLHYKGKPISAMSYYVMGQVCVAAPYRGKGVFEGLYLEHRRLLSEKFDCCITEISTRNVRSLRAHQRIGFQKLHTYRDATDEWEIVLWDWNS